MSKPLSNDHYVEQFKDHPWYYIINWTHERLTQIIPGYSIAQIKEKFGGLRYYISYPNEYPNADDEYNTPEKLRERAAATIRYAEAFVDGMEWHLTSMDERD